MEGSESEGLRVARGRLRSSLGPFAFGVTHLIPDFKSNRVEKMFLEDKES